MTKNEFKKIGINKEKTDVNLDIILSALECQQNNRWIPVSEREPRQNETVIATIKSNNEEFVIIIVYYCEEWKHGEWKMVAWKPLPEPYKEVIE